MAGIGAGQKNAWLVACLVVGVFINLSVGMLWFAFVSGGTVGAAFAVAVAPFILPEVFKLFAVIIVGKSIKHALYKAGIML
jgi:biotin transporter BioY